jgi:GDP-L-fucose synthase
MQKNDSISILGSTGLVGSSITRLIKERGYSNLFPLSSKSCDLITDGLLDQWKFDNHDYVILSAAKVGGIQANLDDPVGFGHDNMQIILNVLKAAHMRNVKKLLYLGSSCIYPAKCNQPMTEDMFMTGPFEPTNEMYAFAKAFGLELCQAYNKQYNTNFISAMPCNIYGVGDNFDPKHSHVVSALIQKFHNAKINGDREVTCWGDGTARRELLYVDDLADACLFLMDNYEEKDSFINVGTGEDYTIRELAETVRDIVGFNGEIKWDSSRPNGMMRKLLDVSKIRKLGWHHKTSLRDGLEKTYNWWISKEKK